MFSFGDPTIRQFGGVGLMLENPRTDIVITGSSKFQVHGPQANRVERFVKQLVSKGLLTSLPECVIEIIKTPPAHSGLGSGTQLALATAAAMDSAVGLTSQCPKQWAAVLERGARSAVGTHGFELGGLIVEAGKLAGEDVSPLVTRIALPSEWRFLLMLPDADQGLLLPDAEQGLADQGLSGQAERSAFEKLPAISPEITGQLCREALLNLVPSALAGCFDTFSESLYRFGHAAGMCFADAQGGAFATPMLQRRIKALHEMGVPGVGQSSWGPTLFALLANEESASNLADRLRAHPDFEGLYYISTAIDNCGVRIDAESDADDQQRPPVKTSDELA